jgi:hypothetical protein
MIRILLLHVVFSSIVLLSTQAYGQVGRSHGHCNANTAPNPDQAIIYEQARFRGQCRVLGAGMYPSARDFGLPNDSISSVKVGRQVRLDLYRHARFCREGNCNHFKTASQDVAKVELTSFRRNLSSEHFRPGEVVVNNSTSSIRVVHRDKTDCLNPGESQVSLFRHINNIGDCIVKDVGLYLDSGEIGLEDNSVSSLILGSRTAILIRTGENFSGLCDDYNNSSGRKIVFRRLKEFSTFHDALSSLGVGEPGEGIPGLSPCP